MKRKCQFQKFLGFYYTNTDKYDFTVKWYFSSICLRILSLLSALTRSIGFNSPSSLRCSLVVSILRDKLKFKILLLKECCLKINFKLGDIKVECNQFSSFHSLLAQVRSSPNSKQQETTLPPLATPVRRCLHPFFFWKKLLISIAFKSCLSESAG